MRRVDNLTHGLLETLGYMSETNRKVGENGLLATLAKPLLAPSHMTFLTELFGE